MTPNDLTVEERNAILDTKVGSITLREMTGITFCKFVMQKLDGQKMGDPKVGALTGRVNFHMGKMPDDEKVSIVLEMKAIGLTIP